MKMNERGNVNLAHDSKDSWRAEEKKRLKFLNCNMAEAGCAYCVQIRRWTLAESIHVRYADFGKCYLGHKPWHLKMQKNTALIS